MYYNNIDLVQKIQVPEGNTIWMRFTDFDCEPRVDYLIVSDGDGTQLWSRPGWSEGPEGDQQFVSNTNTVEVHFGTDGSVTGRGWRLEWGEYERKLDCVYFTQCNYQEWLEMRRACQRLGS